MKMEREKGGVIAWHGTDRTDFTSFDVSHAAPYNVGLQFGTRAAALDRLAYLREHGRPNCTARLIKCRRDIRNPCRVDDVFGHFYVGILTSLEDEINARDSVPFLADMSAGARVCEYETHKSGLVNLPTEGRGCLLLFSSVMNGLRAHTCALIYCWRGSAEFAPKFPGDRPAVSQQSIAVKFSVESFRPPLSVGAEVEFPSHVPTRINPSLKFNFFRASDDSRLRHQVLHYCSPSIISWRMVSRSRSIVKCLSPDSRIALRIVRANDAFSLL